jgi:hypothetical protein
MMRRIYLDFFYYFWFYFSKDKGAITSYENDEGFPIPTKIGGGFPSFTAKWVLTMQNEKEKENGGSVAR